VVRALATGADGPGLKMVCAWQYSKTRTVHPAVAGNWYQALFSGWEGEGGEEEHSHLTSVTPLSIKVGCLKLRPLHYIPHSLHLGATLAFAKGLTAGWIQT